MLGSLCQCFLRKLYIANIAFRESKDIRHLIEQLSAALLTAFGTENADFDAIGSFLSRDRGLHCSWLCVTGSFVDGEELLLHDIAAVEGVTKILRLRAENATVDAECNAITRDSSIRIKAYRQCKLSS